MTRKRQGAFDFSASSADRRRQARSRRTLEREEKRKRASNLKRSRKDEMRQRREMRRLEARRKKEEKRQHQAEERRLRDERKRWQKSSQRRMRFGGSRSDRDMRTATRLVDWFGSILGRVDRREQEALIAYADEHIAEVYERLTPETAEATTEKKEPGPGFIGRALLGLRRLVGA